MIQTRALCLWRLSRSTRLPGIKTNDRVVISLGGSRKEWDAGLQPVKVVSEEVKACETDDPDCEQQPDPAPAKPARADPCLRVPVETCRLPTPNAGPEEGCGGEGATLKPRLSPSPRRRRKPDVKRAKVKEAVDPGAMKASTRAEDPMGQIREPGKGENFHVLSLMEICKLDTPLAKRVPGSQRAVFFNNWGRLMRTALSAAPERQYPAWCEWAMYHKAILWTPSRGGSRLAKKKCYADLVQDRMRRWDQDREKLWEETVHRSKTREVPTPVDPKDLKARNAKVEKAASLPSQWATSARPSRRSTRPRSPQRARRPTGSSWISTRWGPIRTRREKARQRSPLLQVRRSAQRIEHVRPRLRRRTARLQTLLVTAGNASRRRRIRERPSLRW